MCKGNYVFQPGDVVQRKPAAMDSYWCSATEIRCLDPEGEYIVDKSYLHTITLTGLGSWDASSFDLVRRATEPCMELPAHKVPDAVSVAITADAILQNAAAEMQDRAASRDTPEGERSMGRCVKAFNAMFSTELTETQGWQFMELLKMARSVGGEFRLDDFTDGVAYAALAGESEARLKQSV